MDTFPESTRDGSTQKITSGLGDCNSQSATKHVWCGSVVCECYIFWHALACLGVRLGMSFGYGMVHFVMVFCMLWGYVWAFVFYVLKIYDLVCFVVFGMFSVNALAWYSMVYLRLLKYVLLSGMACSGFCMVGYWSWHVLATVYFGYARARLILL